jgi:DNA-binding LacI/PurR family transcriptional regulator
VVTTLIDLVRGGTPSPTQTLLKAQLIVRDSTQLSRRET